MADSKTTLWYAWKWTAFEKVEVTKATDSFITVKYGTGERREKIHTDFRHWFPTLEGAIENRRAELTKDVTKATEALFDANKAAAAFDAKYPPAPSGASK